MTYELARQPKDAGFPYSELIGGWNDYPTLLELIEACGDDFEGLGMRPNKTWFVTSPRIMIGQCDTPEEAVAKLWRALNLGNAGV